MRALACVALLVTGCFSESSTEGTAGDEDASTSRADDTSTSASSTSTAASTTTMATGDASTSAPDTSATSETGEARCGDGVSTGDEACDDANADELDGCTSTCEHGPRLLSFVPADDTLFIGPSTKPMFHDTCPSDAPRVLGGLSGKFGGPLPGWPLSITGSCADVVLAQGAEGPELLVAPAPGVMLPQHGDFNGPDDWSVACPAGQVIAGISGRVYDDGTTPSNIRTLQLHCRSLVVDAEAPGHVGLVDMPPSPWSQNDAYVDPIQTSMCPGSSVAVGIRGLVDVDQAALRQLGAVCATPELAWGPP